METKLNGVNFKSNAVIYVLHPMLTFWEYQKYVQWFIKYCANNTSKWTDRLKQKPNRFVTFVDKL